MSLLIKNGQITTASDGYVADIFCEGETITAIGRNLSTPTGAEVIDASGKYVFPGFIDPHVHIYLPFMGTFSKDTYDSGSRAALVGGTTTLIEMCCPSRTDKPLATFDLWLSKAQCISACDFTFHMGVGRFDATVEREMREIVKRGIASFKIFLAYKGAFGIDDQELYQVLRLAKELGVIVTAHCENAELTDREHADFNEVFFTDVEVPAANLVGELHRGWSVAGGSLAHERGMLWINEATGTEKIIERVVGTATTPLPGGRRLADDPALRTVVARAYVQSQALKLLGYRGFAKFAKGMASPEHSVLKLLGSELRRNLALDVGEALGANGIDLSRHEAPSVGRGDSEAWLVHWLQSFAGTIAGGTSEIQRNIIAERVLGLPRK
jgi:hypothetical protein